jgi:hypothetical protein
MEYYYHVVYHFKNRTGTGTGKINITRNRRIKTFSDVDSIQEYIENKFGFEGVFLMNWIEMEGE